MDVQISTRPLPGSFVTDKTNHPPAQASPAAPVPAAARISSRGNGTLLDSIAGLCALLVVILFAYGFVIQNFVIPSGSMKPTLLIGDHLFVDRITLAPPSPWMPLVYYRQPRRGDVVVFIKPVPDEVNGRPRYQYLVKRLIALPGDHIHLLDGIIYINGNAQPQGHAERTTPENFSFFLDDFPALPPMPIPDLTPQSWAADFHKYIVNGDLVVPPGSYFVMGDNRHNSADSRYWGFVRRANIVGRPLFIYWSFQSNEEDYDQGTLTARVAWMTHIALHLFTDTRWSRTFHVIH
jgi:signal peptidase I